MQVEAPPSVASGLQRIGRAGHQVGEVSRGVDLPEAPRRPAALGGRRRAHGRRRHRDAAHPGEPARHPRAADHRGRGARRVGRRGVVRAGAPGGAVRDAAAVGVRRDARPARRALPVRPLRRAAAAHRVGPRRRHASSAVAGRSASPSRAAARSPTAACSACSWSARRVPGRRVGRARRGDGLRVAGRRRVRARGDELAHPGDHPRPRARRSRVRRAGAAAVLEGRRHRPAGRARRGDRRLHRASSRAHRQPTPLARSRAAGLDERAAANLVAFLDDQRAATGIVPDATNLVVERFRDELGDWRIVLHSPYGMRVHAPWALAVGARVRERLGRRRQRAWRATTASCCACPTPATSRPAPSCSCSSRTSSTQLVTERASAVRRCSRRGSASARRGRCILPRYNPGQAIAALAAAAAGVAAARGGARLPRRSRSCSRRCASACKTSTTCPRSPGSPSASRRRELRFVEVTTESPSPFASSLLFGYVGAFMYEGDAPLAERRAAALVARPGAARRAARHGRAARAPRSRGGRTRSSAMLQRLDPERVARGVEGVADLLRDLGPLTLDEVAGASRRRDGRQRRALAELVARATGGAPCAFAGGDVVRRRRRRQPPARRARRADPARRCPTCSASPSRDPLGDLVARYARTHGPFTAHDVAERFGIGQVVASVALGRLADERRVVEGEFLPHGSGTRSGATPVCSGASGAGRSRRCATRSNRSSRASSRDSCPAGSTSAGA